MIHTKSLIRRLAYVPWLLAFGLVLGWAGEAHAQQIRLTVDKSSLREDDGATKIMVTATNYNVTGTDGVATNVSGGDKYVILDLVGTPPPGLNSRFSIDLNTIKIENGKNAGSAEVTITPIDLKIPDHDSDAETPK